MTQIYLFQFNGHFNYENWKEAPKLINYKGSFKPH